MAVQGQIGHIQIQHNAFRRDGVSFEKYAHQQFVYGFGPTVNLFITIRCSGAQLEPVQRAFARSGFFAHLRFPAQYGQQRILPQLIMIAQILVPQS
jgi:hypothetical protein